MGDPDGQKQKLKPEIRDRLLKIANIFIDYLDVDLYIEDVVLIGSLTGYNWSEFSDFDLHIIYNIDKLEGDTELYKELFRLKKTIFNSKHDITLKGFEVEVYAQATTDPEESAGSYSILTDKWLRYPNKEKFSIDKKVLKEKIDQWKNIIDGAIENAEDETLEDGLNILKKYKDKLRKYRTCGLKKEGEFSYENLVFKYLRRSGYINKLEDYKNTLADKKLSLEQEKSKLYRKIIMSTTACTSYYTTTVVGYVPASGTTVGSVVTFNTPKPVWNDNIQNGPSIVSLQCNAVALGGFNGLNN
jgi:hypothetical protein